MLIHFYSLLKGALYCLLFPIAFLLMIGLFFTVAFAFCFVITFIFNKIKQCLKGVSSQDNYVEVSEESSTSKSRFSLDFTDL